jgi:hypothetical protein
MQQESWQLPVRLAWAHLRGCRPESKPARSSIHDGLTGRRVKMLF